MELYLYSPCLHVVDRDNVAYSADIASRKVCLVKKMASNMYLRVFTYYSKVLNGPCFFLSNQV